MNHDRQIYILNELLSVMHDSSLGGYERLECVFDLYIAPDDGSWSVGSKFSYVKNGMVVSALLSDNNNSVPGLVFSLHETMIEHTGGDWHEFSLILGEDGKARTKFTYKEQLSTD